MDTEHDIDLWSPQGAVTLLTEEESWGLLRRWSFGRIAVSVANVPEIFPINFLADGTSILLRTAAGTKLASLTINNGIAFEADEENEREAWSVSIQGTAHVLEKQDEIYQADLVPLSPWISTMEYVYVRIVPTRISGRHIRRRPTERR